MHRTGRVATLLTAALIVAALQSSTSANHSWNDYHWARSSNPFTLVLGNNVSATWESHLGTASSDWSGSTVLDTLILAGQAKGNCRPPKGRVEVCNASYGNNGWLGIAQIWVNRDSHITQASARMNDTYFSAPPYDSDVWRQYVMCQEVGHTFGLGHQDENFNNADISPGTCMDYTADPTGNEHPNPHDYAQLETIYNSHLDSGTTSPSSQAGAGVDLDSPPEWGRLMKSSRGGRLQVFERLFGNGQRIVTFVIWA